MRSDAHTAIEEPWVTAIADRGMERVRDDLLGRGLSVTQATNLAGWLADQLRGRRLHSKDAVVTYRKLLRSVPPPGYHRSRNDMVGYLSSTPFHQVGRLRPSPRALAA